MTPGFEESTQLYSLPYSSLLPDSIKFESSLNPELLQMSHTDRKLDVITKMLKTVLQKQDEQAQMLKGTSSRMALEGSTVPETK